MTFECIWLLLLLAPTALWTMFNSHRSHTFNHFLIKAFGATLLLLHFCLSGLILRESRAAANVLADALGGLSDKQLKRCRIPLTNLWEFPAG
jgi:hypothetical protein